MDEILEKNKNLLDKSVFLYFKDGSIARLYQEKINILNGKSKHNARMEIQIDLIENELLVILNKKWEERTMEEKELLNEVKRFYFVNRNNTYLLVNSKIFNHQLGEQLFSREEIQEIVDKKNSYARKIKKIYDLYIQGKQISQEDEKELFLYFTSKIGTSHQGLYHCQKQIIRHLFSQNMDYSDEAKNFCIQFITASRCKKMGYPPAKVYISDEDFLGKKLNGASGVSFGDTGLIVLHDKILSSSFREKMDLSGLKLYDVSKLTFLTFLIHHELEHYKQNCYLREGKINLSSYYSLKSGLQRSYLTDLKDNFDEFKVNYAYRETEREANIAGWRETAYFLKEYASKEKFNEIERASLNQTKVFKNKSFGYGVTKSKKAFLLDEYNIRSLMYIVEKNKGLCKQYPLLTLFFHEDGSVKKLLEMVRELTRVCLDKNIDSSKKKEYREVYQEILGYAFSVTDLENTNLSYLNSDEKQEYYLLIAEAYDRECHELKAMMDVYLENNSRTFDYIAQKRIERIKKYFSYLMNHQDEIAELASKSSIVTGGRNREYSLIYSIASFEDRLEKENSYLKGTFLEGAIRDLTRLMGEEKYHEMYGRH